MLSVIVGQIDFNAALVLCVASIMFCIIMTAAIVRLQTRQHLQFQFEIDKNKLKNEDLNFLRTNERQREYDLTKLSLEKDVQFKRIDSGLIEAKRASDYQ